MRRGPTTLLAFLAALAASAPARSFERFDFDQRYFIQPGFIVKDHSLVQARGDTFHLFYIKADETLPEGQRAKTLGHATSLDLAHWTTQPEVIPVVPNTWEESFVWAPHVLEAFPGVWFMYYTGVNRYYSQAIGLAVSQDLYTWYKFPLNPVYRPSNSWALWSPTSWSNCRDPYVFFDGGLWYMTTTTHTSDTRGAISLASSPDLVYWTDLGPLLVHPMDQYFWHVLESSNVHYFNNCYNLFITEQNVGGSTYMSAPSLAGPWDYASRQPFDAGHATEVFRIQGKWMLSRHTTFTMGGIPRYTIKFDDLDWNTTGKPIVQYKDPMSDWTIWSGDAFYLQPTFWDNSLERGSQASGFGGNSWIGTAELFTGPLQVGFPGLSAGEEPRGAIRSRPFTLTGNHISFHIGGGNDIAHLYLALYTTTDGQMRVRSTGNDSDAMQTVVWDVTPWVGRTVFLEIADQSSGAWGHINVDEIQEFDVPRTGTPEPPRASLALHQNVPNPFNPTTRIQLEMPGAGLARLSIFDVRGRLVRTLVDAPLPAGAHEVVWDGTRFTGERAASGIYYYRLQVNGQPPLVRSMVLVR